MKSVAQYSRQKLPVHPIFTELALVIWPELWLKCGIHGGRRGFPMVTNNPILKRIARAILLLWSIISLAAQAHAQFTYTNNPDSTVTITGYTGPTGAVTIPTASARSRAPNRRAR